MSENLKYCLKDLEFVSKIKCEKTQKSLLMYLSKSPKYYLALKEIALNVIKGNVDIDNKTKKKLSKHKKNIYSLVLKNKLRSRNRKKLVIQSGGWLWIIPLITSIIDLALK
jgi:hypothetical protein